MQILDEEPPPQESHIDEVKRERLARAAAQKKKFQEDLLARLIHVKQDHSYFLTENDANDAYVTEEKGSPAQPHLVNELYQSHVVLNFDEVKSLEANTRTQSDSKVWYNARKLRITASIMKEVCHRKSTTSCEAFIRAKLLPAQITTTATCYGKQHEKDAISSYICYQKSQGINVEVSKSGLVVDSVENWLAASPDGIVIDPTEKEHKKGCLEVKCPYVCNMTTITDACRQVPAFCLVEQEGTMCLSESHKYFYQIQTQMHVTRLQWCDFVVWCPKEVFVQRIWYNTIFTKEAVQTAKKFYFEKFLSSVVPYMIIKSLSSTQVHEVAQDTYYQALNRHTSHPDRTAVVSIGKTSVLPPYNKFSPSPAVPSASKVSQNFVTSNQTKLDTVDDVQIVGATKAKLLALDAVLLHMSVKKHEVKGDGNCLYHSIAHQAGLVSQASKGEEHVSQQLRKIAQSMMWKHPDVQKESGLTVIEWLQKWQDIVKTNIWGGDTELRLLAIGLQRDIVVITAPANQSCTFARRFVCQPPPMPKMRGGIFVPITTNELCSQWNTMKPPPLLIIYNGQNHYDSTVCTCK